MTAKDCERYAWRKKPRKFAPKSRLGCITCKIRRIKCDLARPACLKCSSTGRTCDGYTASPEDKRHTSNAVMFPGEPGRHKIPERQPGLALHALSPLMILHAFQPEQAGAMSFFAYVSINDLNTYNPSAPWRTTLLYFSQTVPAVREAAVALALMHQHCRAQAESGQSTASYESALSHYNHAIQLLLQYQPNDNDIEATAITLLVCYLFISFDHLAGNHVQSSKHLRGGVELLRNTLNKPTVTVQRQKSDYTHSSCDGGAPDTAALLMQVTRQFRRLDLQFATYAIEWTPMDLELPSPASTSSGSSQPPPLQYGPHGHSLRTSFDSLDQAAEELQVLIARVMKLRNVNAQWSLLPFRQMPSLSSLSIIKQQLEQWASRFDDMLKYWTQQKQLEEDYRPHAHGMVDTSERRRITSLLRLQYQLMWIYLCSHGPGLEMEFDRFLSHFERCVDLAEGIVAAYEHSLLASSSGGGTSVPTTFTPELGIVAVLYIIGVKCRDPRVRRRAVQVLRRQHLREAVWDSLKTARVVEHVIGVEEIGAQDVFEPQDRRAVSCMEQVPVERRIETLTFVEVSDGRGRAMLDVGYTLCGREESYHTTIHG